MGLPGFRTVQFDSEADNLTSDISPAVTLGDEIAQVDQFAFSTFDFSLGTVYLGGSSADFVGGSAGCMYGDECAYTMDCVVSVSVLRCDDSTDTLYCHQ